MIYYVVQIAFEGVDGAAWISAVTVEKHEGGSNLFSGCVAVGVVVEVYGSLRINGDAFFWNGAGTDHIQVAGSSSEGIEHDFCASF